MRIIFGISWRYALKGTKGWKEWWTEHWNLISDFVYLYLIDIYNDDNMALLRCSCRLKQRELSISRGTSLLCNGETTGDVGLAKESQGAGSWWLNNLLGKTRGISKVFPGTFFESTNSLVLVYQSGFIGSCNPLRNEWSEKNFWMLLCNVSSVVFFFLGGGENISPLNVSRFKVYHHGIAKYINLKQQNCKKQQASFGILNQGGVIFLRVCRISCHFLTVEKPCICSFAPHQMYNHIIEYRTWFPIPRHKKYQLSSIKKNIHANHEETIKKKENEWHNIKIYGLIYA